LNYYKRHIGDYAKKAGRLSMLQHGSYTLLIDACYDREQFPTLSEAIDWTWASSTAEIEAVEFVLSKFFTLVDDRYVQKRIAEEVARFHETSDTNQRIAKQREANRNEALTKRARSVNEAPPNHKPLTINQEPEEKREKPRKRSTTADIAKPADVDQQTWTDWMTLRKAKRAPVTQTTVDGARDEAAKAGMPLEAFLMIWCRRGSQGLEADWLKPSEKPDAMTANSQTMSFAERDELARHKRYKEMTGRDWPADVIEIVDTTPIPRI